MAEPSDDWDRLEQLALSNDAIERRTAVNEAATRTEEFLRGLGYLKRLGTSSTDEVPEKLGDALRLLAAAVPLKDLDTKLRFARETRNRIAHEPEKIKPVDSLQVVSTLHEFGDRVSTWVKSAHHPSVNELRRRAGKYRSISSNFHSTGSFARPSRPVDTHFESIDPVVGPAPESVPRVGTNLPLSESLGQEPPPTAAADLRTISATVRELYDLVLPARQFLEHRTSAGFEFLNRNKDKLTRATLALLGGYVLCTTLALTIGSISSHWAIELVARALALLAFVGIAVFGRVIVAGATMASEAAQEAIEAPRRFVFTVISGIARTQAARDLLRAAESPLAPERMARKLTDVLPRYLVASVTLPLSIWAAWVFCFPFWSVTIWGSALTGVAMILLAAGVGQSTNWEETSRRAKVFVATGVVAGVVFALLALKFPGFTGEIRALADSAGAYTEAKLATTSSLLDFNPEGPWRTAPAEQAERAAVVASVGWSLAFVIGTAYQAISRGAALSGGEGVLSFLRVGAVLLGLGWTGILGHRVLGLAKAKTSAQLEDVPEEKASSSSDNSSTTTREDSLIEKPDVESTPQADRLQPRPPREIPVPHDLAIAPWQEQLFASRCDEPCAGGAACGSNPTQCISRISCIPGEGTELLGHGENWRLHLSAVGLLGPDGEKSDPCVTRKDYWVCRSGTTGCLSQRAACRNVETAAASPNGLVIAGDDLMNRRVTLDVWEGTPGAGGVHLVTTLPIPKLLRRGLCEGYFVRTVSGDAGRVSFFLWR